MKGSNHLKHAYQCVRDVLILSKNKAYTQNFADIGFQFERLVTGAELDGKHSQTRDEILQIMKIGEFNVLFAAEVDAIDEFGRSVEIKSGNPRYFGTKLMFQMISSGSSMLVQANKRDMTLTGIQKRSIHDMIREHSQSLLSTMQHDIISGLRELKLSYPRH
jgi:hypothetical protein